MRQASAQEAAALVKPGDSLAVPLGPGQPVEFLHALGQRSDLEDLTIFTGLLIDFFPSSRGAACVYSPASSDQLNAP